MNISPCSEVGSATVRDRMRDNVSTLLVNYLLQAMGKLLLNTVKGELVFVSPGCISHVFKRGFSCTVPYVCNFRHAVFKKRKQKQWNNSTFEIPADFFDDGMKAK